MAQNVAAMRDAFGHLIGFAAGIIGRLLAGGAGDDTAIYTAEIDARDLAVPLVVENASVVVAAHADLQEDETLTVTVELQHTDDEDFLTPANITTVSLGTVTLTGGAGGSEEYGGQQFAFNPTAVKNRHRIKVTPDLSAADTDTAEVSCVEMVTGLSHAE